MFVSAAKKAIFIHIQKTGGTSVERVLLRADNSAVTGMREGRRHLWARDVREMVGEDAWRTHYKFAFVRNPWDRLVSWYQMCIDAPTNDFMRYVHTHAPTFHDFLTKTTTGVAERTTWNQVDYVSDEQGRLIVDFVGRFETLERDYAAVAARLGVQPDLPHANRSVHEDYRTYYTPETAELVRQRFSRDIEMFGYEFG